MEIAARFAGSGGIPAHPASTRISTRFEQIETSPVGHLESPQTPRLASPGPDRMPHIIVQQGRLDRQGGGRQIVHAKLQKKREEQKLNYSACNTYSTELKPADHLVSSLYKAAV
jgi:hypothetical protein